MKEIKKTVFTGELMIINAESADIWINGFVRADKKEKKCIKEKSGKGYNECKDL